MQHELGDNIRNESLCPIGFVVFLSAPNCQRLANIYLNCSQSQQSAPLMLLASGQALSDACDVKLPQHGVSKLKKQQAASASPRATVQ